MTIEAAIADLTAATTDLLEAAQTRQIQLDDAVADASASASAAATSAAAVEFMAAAFYGAL